MNVLVAGVGNIFLGDDGFGVEVAKRVQSRPPRPGVRVADFGIRGLHLAYELLAGYDALVLVDTMPMGAEPGTVAVLEPELGSAPPDDEQAAPVLDAHTMHPAVVLRTLAELGGSVDRVVIVACEPAVLAEGIGLSAAVADAVGPAADAVDEVLTELSRDLQEPTRERSRT